MRNIKSKNLIIVGAIDLLATILILGVPENTEGIISNIFLLAVITHFSFLILGVLTFVFRFAGFLHLNSFLYLFMGLSNIWLGVLEISLYFFGKVNLTAVEVALSNLFIGLILFLDTVWKRTIN